MISFSQRRMLRKNIQEMRNVLDDPRGDPGLHADAAAQVLGYTEPLTIQADLEIATIPVIHHAVPETAHGEPAPRPTLLTFRITPHPTVALTMQDPETLEQVTPPMSPQEQETVEQYALAAYSQLTITALGFAKINRHTPLDLLIEEAQRTVEHLRQCGRAIRDHNPDYTYTDAITFEENLSDVESSLALVTFFAELDPETGQ